MRQFQSLVAELRRDREESSKSLASVREAIADHVAIAGKLAASQDQQSDGLDAVKQSLDALRAVNEEATRHGSGLGERLDAIQRTAEQAFGKVARRLNLIAAGARGPTIALTGLAAVFAVFSVVMVRGYTSLSERVDGLNSAVAAVSSRPQAVVDSPEQVRLLKEISAGIANSAAQQAELGRQCARRCARPVRHHASAPRT